MMNNKRDTKNKVLIKTLNKRRAEQYPSPKIKTYY